MSSSCLMNAIASCLEESQVDHEALALEVMAGLEGGGPATCGQARTLAQVLAALRDLRDPRGVRYELPSMMSMAVLAVLCGQRAWSPMAAVVSRRDEELLDALGVRRHPGTGRQVTPSPPAFTRLHLAADISELVSVLSAWLAAWALNPGTTAAIMAMRTGTAPRPDPAQAAFTPHAGPAEPVMPAEPADAGDAGEPEGAPELPHRVLSGATRAVLADEVLRRDDHGAICAAPGHPHIDPGLLIRPDYLPQRTAVAVDGKEDRGAKAAGAPETFVLRAVTHHAGILVRSRRIPDKTGEATSFTQLLEPLPLAGVLVTADAAQTNRANAAWLTGVKDARYLMPVLGNQPHLHDALWTLSWDDMPVGAASLDYRNGRITTRLIKTCDIGHLGLDLPAARQAAFVERYSTERKKGAWKPRAPQYVPYLTDLDASEAGPAELLTHARGHWGVESHHWSLDVTFGRDQSLIRTGDSPYLMSTLADLALTLMRAQGVTSYAAEALHNLQQPARMLPFLGL